jgi:hypothetical protein
LLVMITAIVFVPESLPRELRHGGGLRQFASGLSRVLRIRLYVGYMLTAALSGATMMAYKANSSDVLQVQKGLRPLPFALFFASTALAQTLLSVLNAKILGRRFQPRTLIGFGLTLAALAVAALTAGVFALDTPAAAHLRRVPDPDGGFPSNSTLWAAPERATKALLTRSPTLTPNCTAFARSAPQPTAPWATRTR